MKDGSMKKSLMSAAAEKPVVLQVIEVTVTSGTMQTRDIEGMSFLDDAGFIERKFLERNEKHVTGVAPNGKDVEARIIIEYTPNASEKYMPFTLLHVNPVQKKEIDTGRIRFVDDRRPGGIMVFSSGGRHLQIWDITVGPLDSTAQKLIEFHATNPKIDLSPVETAIIIIPPAPKPSKPKPPAVKIQKPLPERNHSSQVPTSAGHAKSGEVFLRELAASNRVFRIFIDTDCGGSVDLFIVLSAFKRLIARLETSASGLADIINVDQCIVLNILRLEHLEPSLQALLTEETPQFDRITILEGAILSRIEKAKQPEVWKEAKKELTQLSRIKKIRKLRKDLFPNKTKSLPVTETDTNQNGVA
jgi:hypothetical protein